MKDVRKIILGILIFLFCCGSSFSRASLKGDSSFQEALKASWYLFADTEALKVIDGMDPFSAQSLLEVVSTEDQHINEELLEKNWMEFEEFAKERLGLNTAQSEKWYDVRRLLWKFYLSDSAVQYWVFYYIQHQLESFSGRKKCSPFLLW